MCLCVVFLNEPNLAGFIFSQLLPHGGDVVRLVSESFRRCGSVAPVLRVKLYDFARHLFVAMGAGTYFSHRNSINEMMMNFGGWINSSGCVADGR